MANMEKQIDGKTVCVLRHLIDDIGVAGMKALVYLLKNGECNKRKMVIGASMGTSSTKGVLLQLKILGLLDDKEGRGQETIYYLTEKGKKIAEHLDMIEKVLSEGA